MNLAVALIQNGRMLWHSTLKTSQPQLAWLIVTFLLLLAFASQQSNAQQPSKQAKTPPPIRVDEAEMQSEMRDFRDQAGWNAQLELVQFCLELFRLQDPLRFGRLPYTKQRDTIGANLWWFGLIPDQMRSFLYVTSEGRMKQENPELKRARETIGSKWYLKLMDDVPKLERSQDLRAGYQLYRQFRSVNDHLHALHYLLHHKSGAFMQAVNELTTSSLLNVDKYLTKVVTTLMFGAGRIAQRRSDQTNDDNAQNSKSNSKSRKKTRKVCWWNCCRGEDEGEGESQGPSSSGGDGDDSIELMKLIPPSAETTTTTSSNTRPLDLTQLKLYLNKQVGVWSYLCEYYGEAHCMQVLLKATTATPTSGSSTESLAIPGVLVGHDADDPWAFFTPDERRFEAFARKFWEHFQQGAEEPERLIRQDGFHDKEYSAKGKAFFVVMAKSLTPPRRHVPAAVSVVKPRRQ